MYTAFTDPFLTGVLEKCWLQLNWLNHNTNYGMYRARGKIDNAYHKRASKVDKEGIEYGRQSQIIGLVADNPRKVRGFRCERLFYEEAGSYKSLSTAWVQGEALITRAGRRTGCRFAWGTGRQLIDYQLVSRLWQECHKLLSSKIGEDCDVNTEVITDIAKGSVTP